MGSESWWSHLMFSSIAIIGILGNSLVLLIYKKHKNYRKTAFHMLIMNLAFADLLAAIFLIFSRFLYLPQMPDSKPGAFMLCNILWGGYILFGLAYVSVYTCVVLTIERWLACIKPHFYRRITKKHVKRAIVIVWVWSFFINSTVFISVNEDFKRKQCQWKDPQTAKAFFALFELTVSCLLPFTTIIILYCHIYYRIRATTFRSSTNLGSRRLTIIVLLTVTALLIGWFPVKISFLLRYTSVGPSHLSGTAHLIFIMMALGNCCVNPFLYGFYSSKFRNEYKAVLREVFCRTNIVRLAPEEEMS